MLREIVKQYVHSGDLFHRLIPHFSLWNKTPELILALMDYHVSLTCFRKLIDYGLNINQRVSDDGCGAYTAVEYAAIYYPPHFYFLSVEICYRHQVSHINMYLKRYMLLILSAALNDEVNEETYMNAWNELYAFQNDLRTHQLQFRACLFIIRIDQSVEIS